MEASESLSSRDKRGRAGEEEEDHDKPTETTVNINNNNSGKAVTAAATNNGININSNNEMPISCHLDSKCRGMFRVIRAKGKALQSGGFGVTVVVPLDEHGNEMEVPSSSTGWEEEEDQDETIIDDDDEVDKDQKEEGEEESEAMNNQEAGQEKTSDDDTNNNKADQKQKNKKVLQYLFLEEVLFLSEQGLLECYPEPHFSCNDNNNDHGHSDSAPPRPLNDSLLYALLEKPPMNLPMASYLVFAHLRQQTFRVIRYSPQRLSLLRKLEEWDNNNGRRTTTTTTTTKPSSSSLRSSSNKTKRHYLLQLRTDVQQSPPPTVLAGSTMQQQQQEVPQFAYCVYSPDSHFSKANPGMPSFLVAITYYGGGLGGALKQQQQQQQQQDQQQPPLALTYTTLQTLLRQAQGIPIKIATVADSGTVVMFGITDYGVPSI